MGRKKRIPSKQEERNIPELQKYIQKSDQAADRLDKARDKIPKKKALSFDREFDEKKGKGKTRLHFKVRKAEKAAEKANTKYFYKKAMYENPNLSPANPISRMLQKKRLKKQYAAELRKKGQKAAKAAKKSAEKTKQAGSFVIRHRRGIAILIALLLVFVLIFTGLSSCSSFLSGGFNGILGTSYTSEDSDLVSVENAYAAMENELQGKIDNVKKDHPGYDEYKYELDGIGHNPHELASILTAKHQSYTLSKVQSDLQKIFGKQYSLTLKEEIEVRYKTETHTDPDIGETTEEEVPYNYYILHVKLKTKPLSDIAREILNEEQLKMYRVYLETSGNKPLVFGGAPLTAAHRRI